MTQADTGRIDRTPINYIRLALRARIPLSVVTLLCGLLGLIASLLGASAQSVPLGGLAATHPATGLCLIGLGVCLLKTRRFGRHGYWRILVLTAILLVCAARIMDAVLTGTTGAAAMPLLGPVGGTNGLFSVETALAIGAFAAATLMRQGNGRIGGLFLAIGLITVFSTVVRLSYGGFADGGVAVFALLGLVSASVAMLSIYLYRPFVRVAFMMGDIGTQTRVMVVSLLVIPWLAGFGLFRLSGQLAGAETAMMISGTTCVLLTILLTTSARHEGSVAARRRAERELAMLDRRDPVTGALNRFGMTEVVEGAWLDFRSSGAQFGLILMDVDYFRKIDATFGSGDQEAALARVAQTVQDQLRGTDALGRWGTSEFLILLKIKDVSNIEIVAARIRRALADAKGAFCSGLSMQPAALEIPLGISDMRDSDDAPVAAIMRADQGLYLSRSDEASVVPILDEEDEDVFIFTQTDALIDQETMPAGPDQDADLNSEEGDDDARAA